MSNLLETAMLVLFGISWPISLIKSYKAGTAKGVSLSFHIAIFTGYICGIIGKLVAGSREYTLLFYSVNALMVLLNILVYFRNTWMDKNANSEDPGK